MAQQTALSVTATPGPVHTFVAKSSAAVIEPVECDLELFVGNPDLLLAYDDTAWVITMGDDWPVDASSPVLFLEVDDEAMTLVCPY